jgi:SAM-dependent methyltransferase
MSEHGEWRQMAPAYEAARGRPDSLDPLVEWPAELDAIGDPTGLTVLDVGCGNGGKSLELSARGAARVVGLDVTDGFLPVPGGVAVRFQQPDLSRLADFVSDEPSGFDRVLFLSSLGYADDEVSTLVAARRLLRPGGVVVVARSSPIRYAVERSEREGRGVGAAYHDSEPWSYRPRWDPSVVLSRRMRTFSDMLNAFCAAGLRVTQCTEPTLTTEQAERYPHKQEWMDRYVGIVVFRLVAVS